MGLIDYLNDAAENLKVKTPAIKEDVSDYLIRKDLKKYFSDDIPEGEKEKLRGDLEKRLENTIEKYQDELKGFARKTATRGSMGIALINDLSGYLTNVPFANVSGFAYALFALKTAAELPALYRYMKKSHDWYGATKHIALKPVNYLIPIIGPALEAGSFERMIKKKVISEAKYGFIKEHGDYVSFEEKIKEKLKTPIKEVLDKSKKGKYAAEETPAIAA